MRDPDIALYKAEGSDIYDFNEQQQAESTFFEDQYHDKASYEAEDIDFIKESAEPHEDDIYEDD